jgi:hypothetical protein
MVAVANHSTVVNEAELSTMVKACDTQMRGFCHDWELTPWAVKVGGRAYVHVVIVDEDKDVPGALAFHDLVNARPVGVVMAKTILETGASVLGPGRCRRGAVPRAPRDPR